MKKDNIHGHVPYQEEEGYVEALVNSATERAIRQPRLTPRHWQQPLSRIAAVVIMVMVLGGMGWKYLRPVPVDPTPLDTFLSNISDDEAAMLDYYCVEEIDVD